ncbi:MAG: CU044_5270 family protein [Candidatus Limnocylindrales bacterium]
MDEIELLRSVGRDVPPPDTKTRQAARMALIEVATGAAARPELRWPHLRLQRPRLLIPAVVVPLVVVLALGVTPMGNRPDPAAAAALSAVADVAAELPAAPSDGYRHTKSEGAWLVGEGGWPDHPNGIWALVPVTRELWVKPDGSGRLIESRGEPIWFGPADKAAWVASGSPLPSAEHTDTRFGATPAGVAPGTPQVWPGSLTGHQDVDALLTDPSELRALIDQRAAAGGGATDYERFTIVGDLLRDTVAAPRVRAALYRVAAGLPGVELIGSVTDRAGRTGTAVAMTSDQSSRGLERRVLIFDPSTSMLLEEQDVLLSKVDWLDANPPTVIGYATYLVSDVVPAIP